MGSSLRVISTISFRYDPVSKEMVEITRSDDPITQFYVHGDIPAFVSPLDGSVVEGRRQYENHMKKHNVVPFEAGDEKRRPPPVDPTPRREAIWEAVDRSMQRKRR
jgi:hypothetical protein